MIRVWLFNIYCSTVTCNLRPAFCTCRVAGKGRASPISPRAPRQFASSLYGYRIKIRKKLRAVNNFVASVLTAWFSDVRGRSRPLSLPANDLGRLRIRLRYSLLSIARKTTAPPSSSAFSGYLTMGEFPLSKFSKQWVYQSLILFTCRKLQTECHDPLALVGKQLWSKAEVRTGGHQLILPKHSPFEYSGLLASGVFPAFCRLDRPRHRRSQSTRLV